MLQNDLLLQAARGEQVKRPPVWLMRQAGRILPEYRAIRDRLKDFKELVTTPHLGAEVTLQPVELLGVDAAIIFSDILVIPEAMGLPYEMVEKRGPWLATPIRSEQDLQKIHLANVDSDLAYVAEAIRLAKRELRQRVPLIGFAGAPFTIFAYMTEGSGSKTFSKAKQVLYQQPALAHQLLQMITARTIAYLKMQIAAGVDIVQIFDSWAGILSPTQYRVFSLPYLAQICDAITEVPLILFAKGAFFALEDFAQLPCQVIGLDWTIDPQTARRQTHYAKTLQGNLDPCALYADFDTIRKETRQMIAAFGPQRYIANLGHGVYPDTPPDHVRCFIDTVKNWA